MILVDKDAPPERTHRRDSDASNGLPPAYQQSSSSFLAGAPSPAVREDLPSPGYSAPTAAGNGATASFYSQHPTLSQGPSSQYLSPEPSSSKLRSPSPGGSSPGFFTNKSATLESLLNPPPPAFARAPQAQFPYSPFAPCVAMSLKSGLDGGFPLMPPPNPAPGAPHPFATHDVHEEDWTRFLGDLKKIGTLSPANRIVASIVPLAVYAGLGPGYLVTRALENRMKKKKWGPASRLVEYWNSYFFHPRMMEVTLAHGRTVYGSSGGLPEEMVLKGYRRREDIDSDASSSSSSSSSDSEDDHRPHDRDARRAEMRASKADRRAERRTRKEERRMFKRERKSRRRAKKADKKEPWKLIISHKPPAIL